jgi:hypothetical protein
MADTSIREQLIAKIKTMSDEQVAALLRSAQDLDAAGYRSGAEPDDDPAVGFLENAPPDYSEHVKEVLRGEVDPHSGWTQKNKLP